MTYDTCFPFSNEIFGKILVKTLGKILLLTCPFSEEFFGKMIGKTLLLSCLFSDRFFGKILGKILALSCPFSDKLLGKTSLWIIGSGLFRLLLGWG